MKKSWKIIVSILAFLVIAIIIAYFFSQRKIVFNQVVHTDWKTYKNEKAGYSIQYPPDDRRTEGGPSFVEFYTTGLKVYALEKNIRYADVICPKQKAIVTIDNMQWR